MCHGRCLEVSRFAPGENAREMSGDLSYSVVQLSFKFPTWGPVGERKTGSDFTHSTCEIYVRRPPCNSFWTSTPLTCTSKKSPVTALMTRPRGGPWMGARNACTVGSAQSSVQLAQDTHGFEGEAATLRCHGPAPLPSVRGPPHGTRLPVTRDGLPG